MKKIDRSSLSREEERRTNGQTDGNNKHPNIIYIIFTSKQSFGLIQIYSDERKCERERGNRSPFLLSKIFCNNCDTYRKKIVFMSSILKIIKKYNVEKRFVCLVEIPFFLLCSTSCDEGNERWLWAVFMWQYQSIGHTTSECKFTKGKQTAEV